MQAVTTHEELTEILQFRLREGGVRLRLNESVAKIEVEGKPDSEWDAFKRMLDRTDPGYKD